MRYAPKGLCLNDFEIVKEGDIYHLIHLQGPPIYPYNAAILETSYGHAISKDLISWETLGPVFGISDCPHFDDSAIWTMSVVKHDNKLWMFYTGLPQEPKFLQQVGLATDDTLTCTNWQRFSENPILSADKRYYQTSGFMAWRDPYVVFDEEEQNWKLYICAKTAPGDNPDRGCVGFAVSENLIDWTVKEPVVISDSFSEMECPVVFRHGDYWYLLVSVGDNRIVYAYKAKTMNGPFEYIGPIAPAWNFAPRVVTDPNGELVLLHTVPRRWQSQDSGEYHRGKLAQPKKLVFDDNENPRLCWYQPLENYYQQVSSDDDIENGLLVASVPDRFSNLSIKIRASDNTEKTGIEFALSDNHLVLRYFEDNYELAAKVFPNKSSVKEIKILCHDEYFEVYCDDTLEMTALGYRHKKGRFSFSRDDSEKEFRLFRHSGV